MWGKIIIPMYRLWLNGLYGLYGPRCPLSSKRPINLISLSLWSYPGVSLNYNKIPRLTNRRKLHDKKTTQVNALNQPVPYGWEYWDSAFCGKKRRKREKIIMEKKRRKKRKFSPYSFPLFLHIIGSIETPHFMEESGEKADLFSIFISAFSP